MGRVNDHMDEIASGMKTAYKVVTSGALFIDRAAN